LYIPVNNTHVKQFTEKKTQRFICIQQVLCRNTKISNCQKITSTPFYGKTEKNKKLSKSKSQEKI